MNICWQVRTMRVLHEHRAVLHGVMDVFLREPLLDWRQETMPSRTTKLGTSDRTKGNPINYTQLNKINSTRLK